MMVERESEKKKGESEERNREKVRRKRQKKEKGAGERTGDFSAQFGDFSLRNLGIFPESNKGWSAAILCLVEQYIRWCPLEAIITLTLYPQDCFFKYQRSPWPLHQLQSTN